MEIAIGIAIGLAIGAALGFGLGRSGARAAGLEEGRREAGTRLTAVAEDLARGRMPEGASEDSPEGRLYAALKAGWTPRDAERQLALREALERVGVFLRRSVRPHLEGGSPQADAAELQERMERAVGALEDLEFFLQELPDETQGQNLGALAQQVSREFAMDQDVSVRLGLSERPVRVDLNATAFMDALYLVLHNAGRFGGGGTVDVTVLEEDGRGMVRVRDRGPGFSQEAFARAFDPFYSTSDEGLGLGLPHARKVLEAMGGRIELTNVPDGGAQVEVSFPTG